MRLGGRVQAAIEVLSDMEKRKRPASEALKGWGLDHRFAGSGDRAAIGNIVYDALRNKASTQYLMNSDKPRRLVLGTLLRFWDFSPESLNAQFEGDKFAPDPLNDDEIAAFTTRKLDDAPPHVQADVPEWLAASFEANFDEEWITEAQSMTLRPPVDLRVNTLKANSAKVAKALTKTGAIPTQIARQGLRIEAGQGPSRQPNVQAEGAFQKGWFEIQDEGSQIVADLAALVLDFEPGRGQPDRR